MKVGGQNSLAKVVFLNRKFTWFTKPEIQPLASSTQFKNHRKKLPWCFLYTKYEEHT